MQLNGDMSNWKPAVMDQSYVDIQVKGKPVSVRSARIEGRTVIATGRWLKIAAVMDEELFDGKTVTNPESFVRQLKHAGLETDIFTFAQKLPEVAPMYQYRLEWENTAVIPITTFSEWWEKRAEYDVRKAVKRARRVGVVVKEADCDDAFVHGICNIYNESPIRQGKPFWHYRKDFESVKRENSTYLQRSAFIGAYFEEQLIGFIRMVYVGTTATTLQVISMVKHYDKKPTNALIAKAVEMCANRGLSHLIYGQYIYNGSHSSLTEFKRRNGFEQVLLPRYYIPLTVKGQIGLKLNLHHRWTEHIPEPVFAQLRKIQGLVYARKAHSLTDLS